MNVEGVGLAVRIDAGVLVDQQGVHVGFLRRERFGECAAAFGAERRIRRGHLAGVERLQLLGCHQSGRHAPQMRHDVEAGVGRAGRIISVTEHHQTGAVRFVRDGGELGRSSSWYTLMKSTPRAISARVSRRASSSLRTMVRLRRDRSLAPAPPIVARAPRDGPSRMLPDTYRRGPRRSPCRSASRAARIQSVGSPRNRRPTSRRARGTSPPASRGSARACRSGPAR